MKLPKMRTKNKNLSIFFAVISFFPVIVSCPTPIDDSVYRLIMDKTAPAINIISPEPNYICGTIVEVKGSVEDFTNSDGEPGKIKSIFYEVPGTTVKGEFPIDKKGFFSFRFITITLFNNFTLHITATDVNGNSTSTLLPLQKISDNGIPSFKAIPGNKQITLQWDSVPGAPDYTLYYTKNSDYLDDESSYRIENVTSPITLSNLANGDLYNFKLVSGWAEGTPECRSTSIRTIPLSEQTLAPIVTGEYRQITIQWNKIPGARQYKVLKAKAPEGPYENLHETTEKTFFIDTETEKNTWYYYKIIPAVSGATIMSTFNGAQTSPFYKDKPASVGLYKTSKDYSGIFIRGNYAYLVDTGPIWDTSCDLQIFDISDPEKPVIIGTCATNGHAEDVFISNNYAYLANGSDGLAIIDISNPKSPELLSKFEEPIFCTSIWVSGSYAYLGDESALLIIDISDPINPVMKASYATTEDGIDLVDTTDVNIKGNYAYFIHPNSGLNIINIRNPESPILAGSYSLTSRSTATSLDIKGNHAYIATITGLLVLDISKPKSPELIGEYTIQENTITIAEPFDRVRIKDNYAYLTSSNFGVYIIDIHEPSKPVLAGSYNIIGRASDIDISGDYAFVTVWNEGLRVLDIQDLKTPNSIKKTNFFSQGGRDLCINKNYAYSVGEKKFYTIDIRDPSYPKRIDTHILIDAHRICLNGNYAYIITTYGLSIFNIQNPVKPKLIPSTFTDGGYDLCISGDYVYIIDHTYLFVYDIHDPETLVSTCKYSLLSYLMGISIKGNHLFIITKSSVLEILDISNPSEPSLLTSYNFSGSLAEDINVKDGYAYVTSGTSLYIIDVSNPAKPVLCGSLDTKEKTYRTTINGKYAYVTIKNSPRIYIINILNPEKPEIVRICNNDKESFANQNIYYNIAINGSYAYLSSNVNMEIIDLMGLSDINTP